MVGYLAVYSDLIERPLLLGAFTAQLALAKEAVLVGAILIEVRGRLVLTALAAPLLTYRRLCHLHTCGSHHMALVLQHAAFASHAPLFGTWLQPSRKKGVGYTRSIVLLCVVMCMDTPPSRVWKSVHAHHNTQHDNRPAAFLSQVQ